MLLGLLAEPECRAATILAAHGITGQTVRARWPELEASSKGQADRPGFSWAVERALDAATERLVDYPRPLVLATEHLLLGLTATGDEVAAWLGEHGMAGEGVLAKIHHFNGHDPTPIEIEEAPSTPPRPALAPGESPGAKRVAESRTLRILDASANRAREGLRVVEDYVRFALDDRALTETLKQLRHDLAAALHRFDVAELLASRDTPGDVGTAVTTSAEGQRDSLSNVAAASFKRVEEALRSLEEYGKLIDPAAAAAFEQLRYRAYTLEAAVLRSTPQVTDDRLASARLYVLVDGRENIAEFERLVADLVAARVDVIQLRGKRLGDRELLDRALRLRLLTQGTHTLFVMNDRPDLALLAGADGVHVGQDELPIAEVRRIVGSRTFIGVSTHTIEQARQAVRDGADYLGIGPVFASTTKQFDHLAGLDFVSAVAAEIAIPAFAIGGITLANLGDVLAAGAKCVAISGAIVDSADPARLAAELHSRLALSKMK
ncbi:MAG TPA: thiamine phosphate synthase [Pirellulales bacterium]|nr:thiamine phosphate synthase [Pirellulales bacterium]